MLQPEEVLQIVAFHRLGWGSKRIAGKLGVSRNTVKRYLAEGGYVSYRRPRRKKRLDGMEGWLRERFTKHRGNCDVVRQDLAREQGIVVSLRTVERACRGYRGELEARARATVRFETEPGMQMQVDFGQASVDIGGAKVAVHLFVATLGYSRLLYVMVSRNQRRSSWFMGMEGAFRHYGGVPKEVLLDNAKPLVVFHDTRTREVVFTEAFKEFARYWGFVPHACVPYRARTKGKDESGVKYVKRNALAGHRFGSLGELEAHLDRWLREVADVRVHGTTGEAPRVRFDRDERHTLQPLKGRPPFEQVRSLVRVVNSEACVEVDTNAYSVPWRLIGESVTVLLEAGEIRVSHGGHEVARHRVLAGSRCRSVDPSHFDGLARRAGLRCSASPHGSSEPLSGDLVRPLGEYEAMLGGGF